MNYRAILSTKLRSAVLALAFGAIGCTSSHANMILGGQIFANGGDVTVTFLGSDAGYDNLLFLANNGNGVIFEGHVTAPGTVADLGSFAAGTELIFKLNNQQGDIWSTGDASRNSDGVAHAVINDAYASGLISVGFEDLNGGGDRDYNDLTFAVGNASVPDASTTLPLVGLAFAGLVGLSRRFRK